MVGSPPTPPPPPPTSYQAHVLIKLMGCHHHSITMQKFVHLTSSLTNHREGIFITPPDTHLHSGILHNSRYHFSLHTGFSTRGLQGCLLGFWPKGQNPRGKYNKTLARFFVNQLRRVNNLTQKALKFKVKRIQNIKASRNCLCCRSDHQA